MTIVRPVDEFKYQRVLFFFQLGLPLHIKIPEHIINKFETHADTELILYILERIKENGCFLAETIDGTMVYLPKDIPAFVLHTVKSWQEFALKMLQNNQRQGSGIVIPGRS